MGKLDQQLSGKFLDLLFQTGNMLKIDGEESGK